MDNLKVQFYGMLIDEIKVDFINIEVKLPMTVKTLNQLLLHKYENLKDYKYRYAVNLEIVQDTHLINKNDEVVLLPPFAGG